MWLHKPLKGSLLHDYGHAYRDGGTTPSGAGNRFSELLTIPSKSVLSHLALDADHMAFILGKTRSLLTSRGLLLCCIAFIFLVSCRVEPFIPTFCTFTPLATGIELKDCYRQVSLPLPLFRYTYTQRYQIEPRPSITIPITKHSILHHLTHWNKEYTAVTTLLPIYPYPYPVVFKV